jgi:2-polyprenyl-3-methyl-5-hydroxy-6-metoxy-1,4-benzoquinol methylase
MAKANTGGNMNIEKGHVYEYEVDLAGQTAPVHVMHLVGVSKRVLEIGCGPGSVTKLLAQQGKCRVTGIELDSDAIKKVTPYCEKIIQADLNSEEWPHVLDGLEPFDVVVAADVLEHLYDPWNTLKRMASYIGSSGYLVISLPHIGHAAVVACLINSDFEYRDWGLLDRTHIRFFGFKNIEALFTQAALKIVEVRYVIKPPEETEFSASWSMVPATVQDAIKSSAYADVYQVVVKAVPLSYPGNAVPLAPPEQRFTSAVIASPASWRKRIAQHLSPRQKQHIRSSLKLFGINL